MTPSVWSVPDAVHPNDRGAEAPDQDTRLLGLAERYLAVTAVADDVAALWDAYRDQQRTILTMAHTIGQLLDRVDALERREARP
jgi:hypothetical protein